MHDAVSEAVLTQNPSFVVVDDARFDASPGPVPLLVVLDGSLGPDGVRLVVPDGEGNDLQNEVSRRLDRGAPAASGLRRAFQTWGAKS
jgi:hypothetical protein